MCAGTPTTVELGGTSVEHHRARADARVLAHRDVAQDVGVVADEDAVAERGVALAVALARAAQRDALVEGHVAADDRSFADHHAGGVIDEEPPAEQRAGMNIDSGQKAAPPAKACAPAGAAWRATACARRGGTRPPRAPDSRAGPPASSAQRDRAPERSGCLRECVRTWAWCSASTAGTKRQGWGTDR